jgi:endoglucanase
MSPSQFNNRAPGLSLPQSKPSPIRYVIAALLLALVSIFIYSAVKASADRQPEIQIVSPSASTVVKGQMTLRFKVDGLSSDQYEPFWAVGNDQWNRMTTVNGISTAEVDTTHWNWNADNSYTFSFIALKKENWQPIIKTQSYVLSTQAVQAPVAQSLFTLPTQPTQTPLVQTAPLAAEKTSKSDTLYVDPDSDAQAKARAWAETHPEDKPALDKLTSQPLANWYGGWNQNVTADVDRYVSGAANVNQVPVLVAYNIPHRDCGSYSAGGVSDSLAYSRWMSDFAKGVNGRKAIVILEPDALAGFDCLSKQAQTDRANMVRSAVETLKTSADVKVYLDAGHPEWQSVSEMAQRLKQAGVEKSDGFSLNVSNFTSTDKNISYGTDLSRKLNAAHFIIDTSRNGAGSTPNNEWCNPSGVKTGVNPSLQTGNKLVDAFVWVKAPGGSDGTCGNAQMGTSAPAAGEWWPQYALSILR